jgi:hypothetical protein
MNLQEIKAQREQANTLLYDECGLFFAFSKSQFEESKTPLKEGEKYVPIFGGGYVPKFSLEKLLQGLEANEKAYQEAIKANNLKLKEIAHEFANHECFYTGDWSVVADMFPEVERATIQKLYKKELKKHIKWCEETGNGF